MEVFAWNSSEGAEENHKNVQNRRPLGNSPVISLNILCTSQ
jgi:hypothetical protein